MTYLNWKPGQPNHSKSPQDYAAIHNRDGTWGDFNDDPKLHNWNPGQVVCLQQLNPGMFLESRLERLGSARKIDKIKHVCLVHFKIHLNTSFMKNKVTVEIRKIVYSANFESKQLDLWLNLSGEST